jgi:hypothetical protein
LKPHFLEEEMRKLIARTALAMIAAILVVPGNSARATAVNFQFRQDGNGNSAQFTGLGAASDSGTFWNQVNITGASNTSITYGLPGTIFESDGVTPSSSTISSFTPSGAAGNVGIFTNVPNGVHPTTELTNTYLLTTFTGKISMTIGGLTPSGSYDVFLYSQNSRDYSDVAKFTAPASSATVTVDNRGMQNNPATPFVYQQANSSPGNNGNYGILSSQIANVSGQIVVDMVQADFEGAFNGFQIVSVPEPTGFAVVAMSGMCLLRRRQR